MVNSSSSDYDESFQETVSISGSDRLLYSGRDHRSRDDARLRAQRRANRGRHSPEQHAGNAPGFTRASVGRNPGPAAPHGYNRDAANIRHHDTSLPDFRSNDRIRSGSFERRRTPEGRSTATSFDQHPTITSLDQDPNVVSKPTYGQPPLPGTDDFTNRFIYSHVDYPDDLLSCSLDMKEIFGTYLFDELEPGDSLLDLVVLVGNPTSSDPTKGVWATTCEEFVKRRWPSSADHILDMFEMLTASSGSTDTGTQSFRGLSGSVDITISRYVDYRKSPRTPRLSVTFSGHADSQPDLLEALSWLYTVLRAGADIGTEPDGQAEPQATCVGWQQVQPRDHVDVSYTLDCKLSTSLTVPRSKACWTPLFPRTACATLFNSPRCPLAMQGVEMSFDLMCLVAGLEYEVVEQGGLILYGARSMVYPVSQIGDCVQWHFQTCDPSQPLDDQVLAKRLAVADLGNLRQATRHFLGLWQDIEVTLGTLGSDSSEIRSSNAEPLDFERVVDGCSFGMTISVPKVLSFTGTINYKIARTQKSQFTSDFERNLRSKIDLPVVLYSPQEKRAWMVSYVSVVLHLARARAALNGEYCPPCERQADGGQAAFDCIKAHARDPLRPPSFRREQVPTVENLIKEVVGSMDTASRETSRGKSAFRRVRERIVGFELSDIAFTRPIMHLKQHTMDSFVSGGWAPMLDAVSHLFFYENLHLDPILPRRSTRSTNECNGADWSKIPKGLNLLAASRPCLDYLAKVQGRRQSFCVAPGVYWHRTNTIFPCRCNNSHTCNRLHKLSSRRPERSEIPDQSQRTESGVVVFQYRPMDRIPRESRPPPERPPLSDHLSTPFVPEVDSDTSTLVPDEIPPLDPSKGRKSPDNSPVEPAPRPKSPQPKKKKKKRKEGDPMPPKLHKALLYFAGRR